MSQAQEPCFWFGAERSCERWVIMAVCAGVAAAVDLVISLFLALTGFGEHRRHMRCVTCSEVDHQVPLLLHEAVFQLPLRPPRLQRFTCERPLNVAVSDLVQLGDSASPPCQGRMASPVALKRVNECTDLTLPWPEYMYTP